MQLSLSLFPRALTIRDWDKALRAAGFTPTADVDAGFLGPGKTHQPNTAAEKEESTARAVF